MPPYQNRFNRQFQQRQQQQQPQQPQGLPYTPHPKAKPVFDLNTDFGQFEDITHYAQPGETLLDFVTSVNIPCAVHEGNPKDLLAAIGEARSRRLVVGAHIGYPDPKNRGYQSIDISPEDLKAWVLVQLGAFSALCKTFPIDCLHVRPHGALYADMAKKPEIAIAVAQAVHRFDPWMMLVVPVSPLVEQIQASVSLQLSQELYIGKRLTNEGIQHLERVDQGGNLSLQGAVEQVRRLVNRGQITAEDGHTIDANIKTVHISAKQPNALELARQVKQLLGEPAGLPLAAAAHAGWLDGQLT